MIRSLNECLTIEDVVALINENVYDTEPPELIASKYAMQCCVESGYEINNENCLSHLGFLVDNGAKFDIDSAIDLVRLDLMSNIE